MKTIKSKSKHITMVVEHINTLKVGSVFTVLDVAKEGEKVALFSESLKRLREQGVLEPLGLMNHAKTSRVMRYRVLSHVNLIATVSEAEAAKRMTMPTVEVGGVWRDLFIKPPTIDPSVKIRVIKEWR